MPFLTVRASVGAGEWRPAFDLPDGEQFPCPIVIDAGLEADGAFSVFVRNNDTAGLYPPGTVLVAVPLRPWHVLLPGRRVILQRIRDLVEVTVCELSVRSGHAWLWPIPPRTSASAEVAPVEMPWPPAHRMWKEGEDRFLIAGVVVRSLVIEG